MRFVDKRARISEKVASVLENTSIENLPENVRLALDKHGINMQQFAAASRADISIAGYTLGKQSKIDLGRLKGITQKVEALSDQDLARVITVREAQLREAQAAGKFGDAVDRFAVVSWNGDSKPEHEYPDMLRVINENR